MCFEQKVQSHCNTYLLIWCSFLTNGNSVNEPLFIAQAFTNYLLACSGALHGCWLHYDWLNYLQMEIRTDVLCVKSRDLCLHVHPSIWTLNQLRYSKCSVLESLKLEVMGHLYMHWWEVIPHTGPFFLSHLSRAPWMSKFSSVNYIMLHNIHDYLH